MEKWFFRTLVIELFILWLAGVLVWVAIFFVPAVGVICGWSPWYLTCYVLSPLYICALIYCIHDWRKDFKELWEMC